MQPNCSPILRGRRILAVEDDYLIAEELRYELTEAGAEVLGPVPTVAEALRLLGADPSLDGAVLDVNLGGEMVFPVVDALRAQKVPVVFVTGYDQRAIPEAYADIPRCEKPASPARIARALRFA